MSVEDQFDVAAQDRREAAARGRQADLDLAKAEADFQALADTVESGSVINAAWEADMLALLADKVVEVPEFPKVEQEPELNFNLNFGGSVSG